MENQVVIRIVKDVMAQAFIDYAMSVITDRALPDFRDGFKPVHRRILFAMHEAGNDYNKAYKKSARMVGDVIGKYHPHGDVSVYDAAVRMAQPFSLIAPLIDGQGNFGSVDGDNAAAMRYTEMRTTRLAGEMFADIGKETVGWRENYDGSETEPVVLPVTFPNILVNGTDGIAVGMATSIPPHNLSAVLMATRLLLDNPDASVDDIIQCIQAPDFPTGGIVHGLDGFAEAVVTGRGRLKLRAKWHEEDRPRGGKMIVVDEIPYQVNKSTLVEKIAELVREKEIEGITGLRDESSKEGIRVVIEIRRDEPAEAIFAALCAKTELETSISYNCVVLDGGVPRLIGLKSILEKWIVFREEVILLRHAFERKQQLAKLHILSGYMIAIAALDNVLEIVRSASNPEDARTALIDKLGLDETQANAVLSLRLQKLTGMELDDIRADHVRVTDLVKHLTTIIESPEEIRNVLRGELENLNKLYGKERQTEIGHGLSDITREDMIAREDIVIVTTRNGYMKRLPVSALSVQNRGTRGRRSIEVGDDDEIQSIHQASTHDLILLFAADGQVYARKGYRIPESGLASKGRHIRNIIEGLESDIAAMVCAPDGDEAISIVVATSNGTVKKSSLSEYVNAGRKGGIRGITLDEGNTIVGVFVCKEVQAEPESGSAMPGQTEEQMMLVSSSGKAIRFPMSDLREIGRTAQGVRGIRLQEGERVVGACVVAATVCSCTVRNPKETPAQ